MPRNRPAFTLIELLIVVVIIGILAAIAIPKFANTKARANEATMKSDLRNLASSIESYYTDNNNSYPTSLGALGTTYRASTGVTITLSSSTPSSWSATATHFGTVKTCALSYGGTGTAEGVVTCY